MAIFRDLQWVEDTGFRCSAVAQLVWHATARNVAYQFQIEYLPPARRRGNTHAQDVAYDFGTLNGDDYDAGRPCDARAPAGVLDEFREDRKSEWPGVSSWPAFDTRSRAYVAFTAEGAVVRNELRRPFCDLLFESVKP